MIHINFAEPDDSQEHWYRDWKIRATAETARAMEAFQNDQPYEFDASIWTSLKKYLLNVFNGKCAYCESKIEHISSGDMEHFRPKKKVTGDKKHKGYYWLAYNLRNLFPSCEKCNRAGGKMNQFPVERHIRVYSPTQELTEEVALLLNPYDDHPENHIKFVMPTDFDNESLIVGTITHGDEKGETSIKVFKLDRPALNERRRQAQINIRSRLYFAMQSTSTLASLRNELRTGREEYSAACCAFADGWFDSRRKAFQDELD